MRDLFGIGSAESSSTMKKVCILPVNKNPEPYREGYKPATRRASVSQEVDGDGKKVRILLLGLYGLKRGFRQVSFKMSENYSSQLRTLDS